MTPKERAAIQQALEALEVSTDWDVGAKGKQLQSMKAITALRKALAEQAEQEPVGHLCEASFGRGQVFWFNKPADNTPLYAAPVRTKDLTDDEVQKLWHDTSSIVPMWAHHLHFARAVIAADREKNK